MTASCCKDKEAVLHTMAAAAAEFGDTERWGVDTFGFPLPLPLLIEYVKL